MREISVHNDLAFESFEFEESFANVTPLPDDGSLKELEIMPTKKAQKAV